MARSSSKVHWRSLLATLGALAAGCGNQASPDPSASGSAAPSATAPAVSQDDYCKRVCERAIACGDAAALAVAGNDQAAQDAVKKATAANTDACIKTCTADKASDTRIALSDKCARMTDCKAFAKCVEELARDFRQP